MSRPTIKDVARKSNVSIATVSKYLNGGEVRSSIKERIDKAIIELNYNVNHIARSLRTKKYMLIGIVADTIINNFYKTKCAVQSY